MDTEPKPTKEQYETWLEQKTGIRLDVNLQFYYVTCQHEIKTNLEKSALWLEIIRTLREINDQYFIDNDERLIASIDNIQIKEKPWESLIDKTFRKNVLYNDNWPNPPGNEWITPINSFTNIQDILRTIIIVKYLDGVEMVVKKLETICDNHKAIPSCDFEAKPEGYYAAHFYFHYDLQIRQPNSFENVSASVPIEVQITTQLKEVVKSVLWEFYGAERSRESSQEKIWQWQWDSNEFAANYLGHILHYVDGMIVGVRNKIKKIEELNK